MEQTDQTNTVQEDQDKSTQGKQPKKTAAVKKSLKDKKPEIAANKKNVNRGPGRKQRNYSLGSFEDAYEFSKSIYDFGSGERVRRLSLFNKMGKSPESSISRTLVSNANKYGLVRRNSKSEFLELSPDGLQANKEDVKEYDKHKVKLKLAVEDIEVFNFLYNKYKGNKIPNHIAIADILKEEFKKYFKKI